jgi:predicted  nucleic acid-binding Zn-ribbon protein
MELSRIDQEIFFLRKKQHEFPGKITQLKSSLSIDKHGTSGLLSRMDTLKAENSKLELELLEHKDGLRKSEDKLMQIKTNEEYDAVHSEISTRKSKITEIENRLLSLISDIEVLSGKITEAKDSATDDEHKQLLEEIVALETENSGLESQILVKETKRADVVAKIGPRVLSVYNRMYNNKKTGMHVGIVNDYNPACSICGCSLTSQRFLEVKRNDKIIICETCGAILVWEDVPEIVSDDAPKKKKRKTKVPAVVVESDDDSEDIDDEKLSDEGEETLDETAEE